MIDGNQTRLHLGKLIVHAYQVANLAINDFKNYTSLLWQKSTARVEGSLRFMVFLPYIFKFVGSFPLAGWKNIEWLAMLCLIWNYSLSNNMVA